MLEKLKNKNLRGFPIENETIPISKMKELFIVI